MTDACLFDMDGVLIDSGAHHRKAWRALLEETLAPARLRPVGLLDPDGVARLVAEHVTARQNHGKALWSLLTLELWREAYLPGARWS